MKRMATMNGWLVAAAVMATTAGCEIVLGTSPNPTIISDGGSTGTTSTASSTGGGGAPVCTPGEAMACYSGAAGTEGVASCKGGTQTCKADGRGFGGCAGEVTPQPETCGNPSDEDCDGHDCAQWAEVLGDQEVQVATAVAVDAAGNSFVCGNFIGTIALPSGSLNSGSSAYPSAFLIKLDPAGTPLWGKAFGVVASCSAVAVGPEGYVVIGGTTATAADFGTGSVLPGAYVAKLSGSGEPTWTRSLSPGGTTTTSAKSAVLGIAFAANGDVVLGGTFGTEGIDFGDGAIAGPSNNNAQFGFVARLRGWDGSGKAALGGWGKILCSGASDCRATGVAADGTGNVLVAGDFAGTLSLGTPIAAQGTRDGFLGKLAPDGMGFVLRHLGTAGANVQIALSADASGTPTLTGTFTGTIDLGGGNVSAGATDAGFVAHYGADGAYKWSKALPNGTATAAADVDGNVFLSGNYTGMLDLGSGPITSAGAGGTYVAKLSGAGAFLWGRGYDGGSPHQLAVTAAGDPILVGAMTGAADFGTGPLMDTGKGDALIVKLSR